MWISAGENAILVKINAQAKSGLSSAKFTIFWGWIKQEPDSVSLLHPGDREVAEKAETPSSQRSRLCQWMVAGVGLAWNSKQGGTTELSCQDVDVRRSRVMQRREAEKSPKRRKRPCCKIKYSSWAEVKSSCPRFFLKLRRPRQDGGREEEKMESILSRIVYCVLWYASFLTLQLR